MKGSVVMFNGAFHIASEAKRELAIVKNYA